MLGVLYAALGAFTFALNNVAMRRGVVTGSVLQGMAMTVPIGGLSFLVMTVAFGELGQLVGVPGGGARLAGGPMLAVAALHEKFTILQVISSVSMLGGSFVTQTKTGKNTKKTSMALPTTPPSEP